MTGDGGWGAAKEEEKEFHESGIFRVHPEPKVSAEPNQPEVHLAEWYLAPSLVKHCNCISCAARDC